MTIRALVYGGVQITGMYAKTSVLYDGVSLEMMGTTLLNSCWIPAGCTIDLNPYEALDLAMKLIRCAEDHGQQTQRQVASMVKRLARRDKNI